MKGFWKLLKNEVKAIIILVGKGKIPNVSDFILDSLERREMTDLNPIA